MANLNLPYPKFIDYAVPGNQKCGVCPTGLPRIWRSTAANDRKSTGLKVFLRRPAISRQWNRKAYLHWYHGRHGPSVLFPADLAAASMQLPAIDVLLPFSVHICCPSGPVPSRRPAIHTSRRRSSRTRESTPGRHAGSAVASAFGGGGAFLRTISCLRGVSPGRLCGGKLAGEIQRC